MSFQFTAGRFRAFDNYGNPLVGGKLYSYASGTTTAKVTYTDATLTTPNTNPILLDARGEADVWLGSGAYTFSLRGADDVTILTEDGIAAPEPAGAAANVLSDLADSAVGLGSRLVAYLIRATGGVARWVEDKLSDTISVKDFGAVGDGVADDTAAINAAITHALSKYKRLVGGVGGTFPAAVARVIFPDGVYNFSTTLAPNASSYACLQLEGQGVACLRYTGTGAAIYLEPHDTGLSLMTTPVKLTNLAIRKAVADKAGGSVGLVVERLTNCQFEGVSFHGWDYAIQNLGGEACIYDLQGAAIERCNTGILIQQKTAVGGVMKCNLTQVRNAYFIDCTSNAVVIRKNPDESATNNGPGGVISFADCNFQSNSSGPCVLIDSPGESPGAGSVTFDRCWWEGHGNTAIQLANARAVLNACFITGGLKPILLTDTVSKVVIEDLEAIFSVTPTTNSVIQRSDATTNGIATQIAARGVKIVVDGIAAVTLQATLGALKDVQSTELLTAGSVSTLSGKTATLAASGAETIATFSDGGTWLVTAQDAAGTVSIRAAAVVASSGASLAISTINSTGVTITGSGAGVVLTNTSGGSAAVNWSALRISRA